MVHTVFSPQNWEQEGFGEENSLVKAFPSIRIQEEKPGLVFFYLLKSYDEILVRPVAVHSYTIRPSMTEHLN